jgi:hypothetical protein
MGVYGNLSHLVLELRPTGVDHVRLNGGQRSELKPNRRPQRVFAELIEELV